MKRTKKQKEELAALKRFIILFEKQFGLIPTLQDNVLFFNNHFIIEEITLDDDEIKSVSKMLKTFG